MGSICKRGTRFEDGRAKLKVDLERLPPFLLLGRNETFLVRNLHAHPSSLTSSFLHQETVSSRTRRSDPTGHPQGGSRREFSFAPSFPPSLRSISSSLVALLLDFWRSFLQPYEDLTLDELMDEVCSFGPYEESKRMEHETREVVSSASTFRLPLSRSSPKLTLRFFAISSPQLRMLEQTDHIHDFVKAVHSLLNGRDDDVSAELVTSLHSALPTRLAVSIVHSRPLSLSHLLQNLQSIYVIVRPTLRLLSLQAYSC